MEEAETPREEIEEAQEDESYRISLDIYNGPLDLLLYLVYKNELDIFNIPIVDILEQYLEYVEFIKDMDIEIAGDFMVMASRLMNIKSKLLMPRPEAESEEEEIIDPRAELVKELLEYKEYKERAYALEIARSEREVMFERKPPKDEKEEEEEQPLSEYFDENVTVWDLLVAFHQVTKDFMPSLPRKIVYDDTPVSVYVDRIVDMITGTPEKKLLFRKILESQNDRGKVIGMFLGILEAAKRGLLNVEQVQDGGEIYLAYIPEEERMKPEERTIEPGPVGEEAPAPSENVGDENEQSEEEDIFEDDLDEFEDIEEDEDLEEVETE